jgi:hypothetical protein
MTTYCAPCLADLALVREAATAVSGTAACMAHAVMLTHTSDTPQRRLTRLSELRTLAEGKLATASPAEVPTIELLIQEYALAGAMDMTVPLREIAGDRSPRPPKGRRERGPRPDRGPRPEGDRGPRSERGPRPERPGPSDVSAEAPAPEAPAAPAPAAPEAPAAAAVEAPPAPATPEAPAASAAEAAPAAPAPEAPAASEAPAATAAEAAPAAPAPEAPVTPATPAPEAGSSSE